MKKLIYLLLILFISLNVFASENPKPNILFIAIDDMNDWTGFLGGHPQAITPNLDKLAEKGINFTNAHASAPACSPSRNALLYGIEPYNSGLYPFYDRFAIQLELQKKYVSLPRFFKENGYQTYGAGKIFHGKKGKDDPQKWNEYYKPKRKKLEILVEEGYQRGKSRTNTFAPTANPLADNKDYKYASYGIEVLNKKHDKPFFLAVGFQKPHLPLTCPKQFFDALPAEITAPPIKADDHDDIPWIGRSMSKIKIDYLFTTDDAWNEVRRAYLACISWVDFNAGRVLDALEKSEYADNTIVVLWSDHGFHLGEKRSFSKFSLWEESTRVPFIIYDTRKGEAGKSGVSTQAVSLINIYKTLAEMAGLEVPEYVDGFSLVPYLEDPSKEIKIPVITTWGRGNYGLRSKEWRYIRYYDGTEELYNHKNDPDEWVSLANKPEYKKQKQALMAFLPKKEAPLMNREGSNILVGADNPATVKRAKREWAVLKSKMIPALAN